MNNETRTVLGKAIEVLFRELNIGMVENARYRVQQDPLRPDLAFSIAEKAPPGVRFSDGQNWKRWIGPTWRQCEQIALSSNSIDEIVHRWRKLVFEGIDTTRTMNQDGKPVGVSELEFNQKVDERVQAILKDHLAKLMAVRNDREFSAVANTPVETPKGLQTRRKSDNQNGQKRVDMWTERAQILGLSAPPINSNGQIHGLWLGRARVKWEAHIQKQKPETVEKPLPSVGSA